MHGVVQGLELHPFQWFPSGNFKKCTSVLEEWEARKAEDTSPGMQRKRARHSDEAKDSQLFERTVRANGLQTALEEAQAAAGPSRAAAVPQAASASHAEMSDMDILVRAIGIVKKHPSRESLKPLLLSAIGE